MVQWLHYDKQSSWNTCLLKFIRNWIISYKQNNCELLSENHDDVIKWKYFLRYLPFVRGNHRSPVNSHHKDQWRGTLMFSLICTSTNGSINNRDTGDLRRYRAHYDVTVMFDFFLLEPVLRSVVVGLTISCPWVFRKLTWTNRAQTLYWNMKIYI